MRRRRSTRAWVKWVWGVSLTTMSTGCCICSRYVPAHDSLTVKKAPPGALDEAACLQICGEDARCFEATANVLPGEARMVCTGDRQMWEVAIPAVAEPGSDEERERAERAGTPPECLVCNTDGRTAQTCAELRAQIAEGDRLVLCFKHLDGQCVYAGPGGRAVAGIAPASSSGLDTAGACFARLAHAERASVHAFRALARDLARFGAPARLVRRARRSAREEERHALAMKRLARRHAAPVEPICGLPRAAASLRELAIANAVEGCVREGMAALLVAKHARTAPDPAVRHAFARIAPDEARHAALSLEVHRFAMKRLPAHDRTVVVAAMEDARRMVAG